MAPRQPPRVAMLDLPAFVPYYTAHLCAALEATGGARVQLVSVTYQHDPECFRRFGVIPAAGLLDVSVRARGLPGRVRRPIKLAEYLVNLAAVALRTALAPPDVLHVQFLPLLSRGIPVEGWLLRCLRGLGVKVVYTVHNVLPQNTGSRYHEAYQRVYRSVDRLICHDSNSAARLIAEFGVAPGRLDVIPHGALFAAPSRPDARARLGFEPGERLALFQGILRPYKGVPFLLAAWQRVVARGLEARLIIAGTGDEAIVRETREAIAALGLEGHVRLDLRFLPVDEMADLYSAADILVYPYSEITTSGALMTGVPYGKAVVASDLPAFRQVLRDEENALLTAYGDVDALADRLARVIEDGELRKKLGANLAAAHNRTPGWDEIARRTLESYRSAVPAVVWGADPIRT